MKTYRIVFSKQAQKDIDELTLKQKSKLKEILENIILPNPYVGKALKGELKGLYPTFSRLFRIKNNIFWTMR